jgi:hypothetical protein
MTSTLSLATGLWLACLLSAASIYVDLFMSAFS